MAGSCDEISRVRPPYRQVCPSSPAPTPSSNGIITGVTAADAVLGLLFPSGTAANQMQELASIEPSLGLGHAAAAGQHQSGHAPDLAGRYDLPWIRPDRCFLHRA
jgi:hypothetical protein